MSLASRVVRNLARSKARTIGVALLVGVSLAIFLILSQLVTSTEASETNALQSLQNVIEVSPAGSSFFGHSGHITANILPEIENSSSNIVSARRIVLGSNFQPGSGGGGGGGFGGGGFNFKNISQYEGIDTTSPVFIFSGFGGAVAPSIVTGRLLGASDESTTNAMVGQNYATNNNLVVGSAVDVNGTYFSVVGIFSTGTEEGGNTIVIPYPASLNALNVPGPSIIYIQVNEPGNVAATVLDIQNAIGTTDYDTIAPATAGSSFEGALTSTVDDAQFGEYVALAVGAAVMILVMVLVTLQRTREIGVLKALGFGNGPILIQLLSESVLLSLVGLPIGLIAAVWLGPTVNSLIFAAPAGGGGGGFSGHTYRFGAASFGNFSFAITPEVLALGVAVTVGFGLIGAAYPILRALRLKPTEALRHE